MSAEENISTRRSAWGLETEPETWREDALCRQIDADLFFPDKGVSAAEAKRVCTFCDVRHECLNEALTNDERFGVWGGLSERERRRLKPKVIPITASLRMFPPTSTHKCGTETGAKEHRARGEHSCARCKQAATDGRRNRTGA